MQFVEMQWTTQLPESGYANDNLLLHLNMSVKGTTEGTVVEQGASLPTKIAALSLLPVVIICGLFGNGLVCRAVFRYQKLRCVANTFIVSLAVCDLGVCGIIMPFAAYQELTNDKQWHLGPVVCNIWVALDVLLCTASIWNMCVIALDRCMAITNPVWYVNRRTPFMATVAIASAWSLSILLSVMFLLLMDNFADSADYSCQVAPKPAIAVVSSSVTFYIPCLIVVAVYIKIFLAARRHLRKKSIRAAISTMHMRRPSQPCVEKQQKSSSSETQGNGHTQPLCTSPDENKNPMKSVRENLELQLPNVASSSNNGLSPNNLRIPNASVTSISTSKKTSFNLSVPEPSFSPEDGISGTENSDINEVPRSPRRSLTPFSFNYPRPKIHRISVTRERRAAAVLAVVIGVFICCWLPFFIVYVIIGICEWCHVTNLTFQVLTWLGWCNSILNPLIYTVFNLDFRHAFRKILLDVPCQ
ncbi:5-hydroxytryptamine receptor 1D-like [Lytechinus variegatus]|uniref:5-hydroxytryptamine receptor 1D-like n=1 Tax=Lytechinus variegatus TaxID=7654 RepID=UPI001BB13C48|nr:5-hydroxytryptamine receptor 1D-like [Lytechinus variegatus]